MASKTRRRPARVPLQRAPATPSARSSTTSDPLEVLGLVAADRRELDTRQLLAVGSALGRGHSWREIGDALGVSRQAARTWFTRHTQSLRRT